MNYFSIIIPHHDIPLLLDRCLNSIPWDKDIEVIIVDDGSSNENLPSVRALERKYDRARFLYTNPARGAGYARNIGLSQASGTYVLFMDADDFFNPCISDILEQWKESNFDIVFFNANSVDTDSFKPAKRSKRLNKMIERYQKGDKTAMMLLRFSFGEPWCKIVKRSVIEKHAIRFDETIIHNDTKFSYLVGFHCTSAAVDSRKGYCVTDRQGSVSKKTSLKRLLLRTEVFSTANKFYEQHGISLFEERALRPFIIFFLTGRWRKAAACRKAIMKCGYDRASLARHLFRYPYYVVRKFLYDL